MQYLINVFLNDRYVSDDIWEKNINIFKSLNITSNSGHHNGLSYQILMNKKSYSDVYKLLLPIITKIKTVIITIEQGSFENDDSYIKSGKYFDTYVKNEKYGIYVIK